MKEKPNLAILKREDALRLRALLGPSIAIYAVKEPQPLPPGAQAALEREEERGLS